MLKVRNQNYSQWVGREELLERELEAVRVWDSCVVACDEAENLPGL